LSVGPIPWNQIRDYADFAGLDRENGFAFCSIMRKLDAAYLGYLQGEQQRHADQAGKAAQARAALNGGRSRAPKGRR